MDDKMEVIKMIYYYIPDFFWHYHVNLKLLELMRDEPQMFYDDFKIGAVFGNFPNCIWNGGGYYNGRHVTKNEQLEIAARYRMFGVPLRLTMTNPVVEATDVYDRYSNYIMENLNDGFNQVLISNKTLEEYVRKTYPEYPIVRSILSTENVYYDDSDRYFMSVLRKHKNSDIEFLKSIKNKDKIEMLANETCIENCPRAYLHYLEFSKKQRYLDNTGEELLLNCDYNRKFSRRQFYTSKLCITREKIKEIYEPMGFKHFKISGRGSHGSIVLDYAHYMVKPEYKEDFIAAMMDPIVADNR